MSLVWDGLEDVGRCEGLPPDEAAKFLVRMYQAFPPGYPGGHTRLRNEYRQHVRELGRELATREIELDHYLTDAFPNSFMWQRGVRDIVSVRNHYGIYAHQRLEPLDAEYTGRFLGHVASRVPALQDRKGPIEILYALSLPLTHLSLMEHAPEVRMRDLCEWVDHHVVSDHPRFEDAKAEVRSLE